jgi:LuxR family maltose regulon positive regulatory protein
MLRACLYAHQGERKKALESLNQALAEAKPEGCIRVFLDGGPILEKLLMQFCKEPAAAPLQDYLQTLLFGFKNEGYEPVQRTEKTELLNPPAKRLLIDPLNERELEILRLIAQGLTNREIANHLSLSPKTIKWHAYNLYAKLGVNSRTQALASAREQSLI